MKNFLMAWVCVVSTTVSALTVNRLNGSATILYIDFSIPGPVLSLELVRAYNSITAVNENSGWNGAFGWGWTSLAESLMTITGDRKVLLRDGLSGNTLTFAAEKEDPSVRQTFLAAIKKAYFKQKLGREISAGELSRLSLPDRMQSQLLSNPAYRAELAVKYNVTSPVPRGEVLVSSEYGYQTIEFRNNHWIRLHDGIAQEYDKEGRIIRQTDKNGFTIWFRYSAQNKNQIAVIESDDKSVSLRFSLRKDRISEIVDNRNLKATYQYDKDGNLIDVTDSANQKVKYKYESKRFPHLITSIEYLSSGLQKASREIRYDENGLVTFQKDKDGTETTFSYGKSPSNPQDNFWTKFVTKVPNGRSDEQYDEYTIKTQPNGIRYLYRQETRKKGKTVVTVYTPCCGKPARVVENGAVTDYKYYPDGLLMEKISPSEMIRLEYDPRWKKISKISQNGVVSDFRYDSRGNLIAASNSRQETVNLDYDRFGRIVEMRSPTNVRLSFRYGNQGKPILIENKQVGTIRIAYDPYGKIIRTETVSAIVKGRVPSRKQPQEVIQTIMKGFQNLLNIIRPAGVQMSMG